MDTERSAPWWSRTIATIGFPQMAHRPPLPRRWAVYCVAAYLIPIVVLEAVPEGTWTYKELSWLTTLAPAFILSLHFGMLGSLIGLIVGTVLYLVVQLVLQLNLMPVNPNVLMPIYISYGALAIAVGWLSQQLHDYYHRLIKAERLAAIGEVAVTIRHEVNNALAAIVGQAGLLKMAEPALGAEDRAGVDTILEMANRISADLRKLADLADAPSTGYYGDVQMVDLRGATPAEGGAGA